MMSKYSRYDWIRKSIDATLAEAEEVKALNERLKNSRKNEKHYFIFPEHIRKNPLKLYSFEDSKNPQYDFCVRISEN